MSLLFAGSFIMFSKWKKKTNNLQLATGIAATTHWSINIALMIFIWNRWNTNPDNRISEGGREVNF